MPGLPTEKAVKSNRNCHENYFGKETFATAAGRVCTMKEETAPGKSENLTKTWGKRNSIAILKIILHTQEVIDSMKSSCIPEIVYGRIIQEKWRLKMQKTTK